MTRPVLSFKFVSFKRSRSRLVLVLMLVLMLVLDSSAQPPPASKLWQIGGENISRTPTNLQVIQFNATTGKWQNATLTIPNPLTTTLTGFTSGAGTVSASDTILGAFQKINGNVAANTTAIGTKQNTITTGTTAQYFRGDLSLATFPTALSSFSNDTNFITSAGAPVQSVAGRTGAVSLSGTDITGGTFGAVSAANLTSIPAGNLTGSIADGRLSANVPLKDVANVFTGNNLQTFGGSVTAAQTVTGNRFLANATSGSYIALNSTGANYGLISNGSSTSWFLGYGASASAAGTAAYTWDSSGNGTVANNLTVSGGTINGVTTLAYTGVTTSAASQFKLSNANGTFSGRYLQLTSSGGGSARSYLESTVDGNVKFWDSQGTTPADLFAGSLTVGTTLGANTVAAGLNLTNANAATSGNQQYSPALVQTGQGWKTTSTASSQSVSFRSYVVPVQGSTAPTANWTLESSVNGGTFGAATTIDTSGNITTSGQVNVNGSRAIFGNFGNNAAFYGGTQSSEGILLNNQSAVGIGSAGIFAFRSGANNLNLANDLGFSRISAGLGAIGTGATGSFAGSLKLTDLYTNDASFLIRTNTTITGGGTSQSPTLTAGPVAGNPTKWIGIDDNGTTRYIPTW